MSEVIKRLEACRGDGSADSDLLQEAIEEIRDLRKQRDAMEEILIMLVRTAPPWDEDGNPTDTFPAFRERFTRSMHEAAELLGLEFRSTITRTEPKTM